MDCNPGLGFHGIRIDYPGLNKGLGVRDVRMTHLGILVECDNR